MYHEALTRLNEMMQHNIAGSASYEVAQILIDLSKRVRHLEEQAAQAATSAPSSPAATPTPAETPPTWSTSRTWSFHVNQGGYLQRSALRDIWDWLNSRPIPGNVQEVEIGVTLTSKAATSPGGLPSPSTEAPLPARNGLAGSPP